jgi:tetratricopeptide (TPR) repeat protein
VFLHSKSSGNHTDKEIVMDVSLRKKMLALGLVLPLVLLVSCASLKTKIMLDNLKPIRQNMKLAINKNSDLEMVKQAMPAGLIQLDGFIHMAPDNKELLVAGAESYSGYAFAFVEDEDPKRAGRLYQKARDYAFRALRQNEAFDAAFDKQLPDFEAAVATFEKEDVPALFHATNAWLKWIKANLEDPAVLMDLPKAEALMFKTLELDENFQYGTPHALVGAYYSARSKMLGGQPEKAKIHFERAFEISESKFLVFDLLYARYYAVQIQDAALFEKTLKRVINAPENLFPEKNLANEIARRKAKTLLAQKDEFF